MSSLRSHLNNCGSRLFPASDGVARAPNKFVEYMGVGGLLLYILLMPIFRDGARVGESLMLLAFVLSWRQVLPALRRDPLAHLCLVWIAYLLLSAAVSPVPLSETLDEVRRMSRMFFFLVIAWWVGGQARGSLQVYLLALAGLLLAISFNLNWQSLEQIFSSKARLDFGIINPLHFGLYCAISLLGIVIFHEEIWGSHPAGRARWMFYARLVIWLLLLLILLQGIVGSQARGIWVALAITLICFVPYFILSHRRGAPRNGAVKALLAAATVVILGSGLIASQWEIFETRYEQEKGTITHMITDQEEEAPLTSLGIRLHLWEWGVEQWQQRPWLGWGARSTRYLLNNSDLPSRLKAVPGLHVHNTYLELLITTGLVGLLILVIATACLFRGILSVRRQGALRANISMFSLAAALCFASASMTNVYINSRTGMFLLSILGGAAYSVVLYERRRAMASDVVR